LKNQYENQEIALHTILGLAHHIDPKNKRLRKKPSFFKTLNAIYIMQIANEKRGRFDNFPDKETLRKNAKISRSLVTKFVTSPWIKDFCVVIRRPNGPNKRFNSNLYRLHEPVYQWFRLMYRSGMMRGMHVDYTQWLADFTKRVNNWLLPLVEEGHTIADIYTRFVNKLSTKKSSKVAAVKPLKVAGINPPGESMKHSGYQDTESLPLSVTQDFHLAAETLISRFSLREGDVNMVMNSFRLRDIRGTIRLRMSYEERGFVAKSPIKAFMHCMKEYIKSKNVSKMPNY
jgi:hypothetical protein